MDSFAFYLDFHALPCQGVHVHQRIETEQAYFPAHESRNSRLRYPEALGRFGLRQALLFHEIDDRIHEFRARFHAGDFGRSVCNRVPYACEASLGRFSSCTFTNAFARERLHALAHFREQIALSCAMVIRFR